MALDVNTLLVAVALATALCAAARFLLWRMHMDTPGLGFWAWASVLGAVALFLIAFRSALGGGLVLTVAQLLIAGGFLLAWEGMRRFLGLSRLTVAVQVCALLAVLASSLPFPGHWQLVARSVSNAVIVAAISGLIAKDLLTTGLIGLAQRITGLVYGANACFFVLRSVAALADGGTIGLPSSNGFSAFSLLWWLCVTVTVTLCMALMTGQRLQANLNRQASRDPLTGVLNRRSFALVAAKEIALARRGGLPCSVLMMDLDHFKRINDLFGHAAGDAELCRFVEIAARELRGADALSRFGGEEFVALLPGATADQALVVAERLRQQYQSTPRDQLLPGSGNTVSIGVCEILDEEEFIQALKRADAALYRAKAEGRNRCLTPLEGCQAPA